MIYESETKVCDMVYDEIVHKPVIIVGAVKSEYYAPKLDKVEVRTTFYKILDSDGIVKDRAPAFLYKNLKDYTKQLLEDIMDECSN